MCKVLKGRRIENTSEVTRDDKGHRWIKINILIDFIVKQIENKTQNARETLQFQLTMHMLWIIGVFLLCAKVKADVITNADIYADDADFYTDEDYKEEWEENNPTKLKAHKALDLRTKRAKKEAAAGSDYSDSPECTYDCDGWPYTACTHKWSQD